MISVLMIVAAMANMIPQPPMAMLVAMCAMDLVTFAGGYWSGRTK
jgi:hypothetical protein